MKRIMLLLLVSLTCGAAFASESHPDPADTLRASVVRGERSARSVVKDASRDFAKNYADYYASFLIVRTIKSDGRFREVQSAVGVFASLDFNQKTNTKLYWDDRNVMGRLYVCDAFVSESLYADRNEVNPVLRVISKGQHDDMDALKVNYVNAFDASALDRKRAVEIFSPLNPKMIDSYTYKSSGASKVDGKDVRVIDFSSKSRTPSAKERIVCSGRLFIDKGGRVRKIELRNMDDRFTRYIRNFSDMILATPYTYTITYGEKDGWIYTESITQDLSWRMPEVTSGDLYCAEWNPCRNPFKNHMATSFVMTFSEPRKARSDGRNGAATPANTIVYYSDSHDFEFWKRILSREIDLGRFLKDTGTTWDDLCGQALARQEREIVSLCAGEAEVTVEKSRLTTKASKAREVYKTIFKKDYTEGFTNR